MGSGELYVIGVIMILLENQTPAQHTYGTTIALVLLGMHQWAPNNRNSSYQKMWMEV
jgi:hypothetical protein